MEFQRVDKKAKTKWRFSRIIALIFAVIPAAVSVVFVFNHIGADEGSNAVKVVGRIIAGLMVLFQFLSIIIYPPIEYIQWAYKGYFLPYAHRHSYFQNTACRRHTGRAAASLQAVHRADTHCRRRDGDSGAEHRRGGGNMLPPSEACQRQGGAEKRSRSADQFPGGIGGLSHV